MAEKLIYCLENTIEVGFGENGKSIRTSGFTFMSLVIKLQ